MMIATLFKAAAPKCTKCDEAMDFEKKASYKDWVILKTFFHIIIHIQFH